MKNNLAIMLNTPWKLCLELAMYAIKPFVLLYLYVNGVEIGSGSKFYGFPLVLKHRDSKIVIGNRFECRSWWFSNPLGLNRATILCTWKEGAKIIIGDDVGVSGTSITSSNQINIGEGTLIGANSTLIDTDFHPLKSPSRRYQVRNVRSAPIKIGKNVFIGMNSIILKGVKVADHKIIPAGTVLRKNA